MKILSVIEKLSRKIEAFFEEVPVDNSIEKELSRLERRIYSQGKTTTKKYSKLLSDLNEDFLEIDNKSIGQSVKSIINSNGNGVALEKILNGISLEEFLELKYSRQIGLIAMKELDALSDEHLYSLMFELQSLVTSVEGHLRKKKIKKLLIGIIDKIQNPKIQLHNRIQLTTSLLSYFDQVFTLKKVNSDFTANCSGFIFNLNTKSINNGRKAFNILSLAD